MHSDWLLLRCRGGPRSTVCSEPVSGNAMRGRGLALTNHETHAYLARTATTPASMRCVAVYAAKPINSTSATRKLPTTSRVISDRHTRRLGDAWTRSPGRSGDLTDYCPSAQLIIHVYTFNKNRHHFGCRDRSDGFSLAFSGFTLELVQGALATSPLTRRVRPSNPLVGVQRSCA